MTQAPYAFWLQLIPCTMISVSLISLTVVVCHQMINSDTEARSSLEMMNCSFELIYKAVCPDKKSNPLSILETVLMTYSSNVDTGFSGSLSVMLLHWRLLEGWFVLDLFQECLVTNTLKRPYYKAVLALIRQDSRKVLRLSCVSFSFIRISIFITPFVLWHTFWCRWKMLSPLIN